MVSSKSHVALQRRPQRGSIVASILLLGMQAALAAPGDLDPSFSDNGLLSLRPAGDSDAQASAITQQTDGKLVLAGWGSGGFLVARVTEDGTPDDTFGIDGFATTDLQGGNQTARAVVQQPDGKLALAGIVDSSSNGQDIGVARFNSDGVLDDSFGNHGVVTLDIGGSHDRADALIQQADGKLVIAGATISGGKYHLLFARFNADGTVDTTFGSGGTTLVDFGAATQSTGSALVEQLDGKLVVAGTVYRGGLGSSTTIGIARVTANGTLDPSFDDDGRLVVDLAYGAAQGIAIQPDGAILVAGYADHANGTGGAVLRVNGNGSIDSGFGSGGFATVDLGDDSFLGSLVVQADGKLVAAGGTRNSFPGVQDMVLTRLNADGTLDADFGVNGVAIADFGTGSIAPGSRGDALIRQFDGKYVAVGWNDLYSMCAARFDDDADFPGLIGLTETSQAVTETIGKVTYAIRRSGGKTGAVSVDYATTAVDAQAGSDFEPVAGTLTWNDGDASSKAVVINLVDDDVAEADKEFTLTLSMPTGGAQLAATEASTVIASEDGPGQLRFGLAADVFEVSESDPFCEGDSTFYGFTVPVARASGSTGAVGVSYSTIEGTAVAPEDFEALAGTVGWADGERGVKWVRFNFIADRVPEDSEEFQIELSDPKGGATIDPSASTLTVRILDVDNSHCDRPPPPPPPTSTLIVTAISAQVGEGGSVDISVVRSASLAGAVSVVYHTASGTATAGTDFTSASGRLTWADGDGAKKTFRINTLNDATNESDETFTVTLSNPSAGANLVPGHDGTTVTITDDDAGSGGGGGGGTGGGGSGGTGGGGGGGGLDWLVVGLLSCLCLHRRRTRLTMPA